LSFSLDGLPLSDHSSILDFADKRSRAMPSDSRPHVPLSPRDSTAGLPCLARDSVPSVRVTVTPVAEPVLLRDEHQASAAVPQASSAHQQSPRQETPADSEKIKVRRPTAQTGRNSDFPPQGQGALLEFENENDSKPEALLRTRQDRSTMMLGGRETFHPLSGGESRSEVTCKSGKDGEGEGEGEGREVMRWSEEDAETADCSLRERLISFHKDRDGSGGCTDSLQRWMHTSASNRERECFRRMTAVGRAFFDSPSIQSGLGDRGISLREFREGVQLLLHLHPAQLLQLYGCFLAAACTILSSSRLPL